MCYVLEQSVLFLHLRTIVYTRWYICPHCLTSCNDVCLETKSWQSINCYGLLRERKLCRQSVIVPGIEKRERERERERERKKERERESQKWWIKSGKCFCVPYTYITDSRDRFTPIHCFWLTYGDILCLVQLIRPY